MKGYSIRRLYLRKLCPLTEIPLVGPTFDGIIRLNEISLGGFKIEFLDEILEALEPNTRIRLQFPTGYPQESIIAGGQIIWVSGTTCGIKLLYTNCSTLTYQKMVDQLDQTVSED